MTKETTLPAQIQKTVEESGVLLNKAQAIAINYAPLMESANNQAELLKDLTHENAEDVEKAKRIRLDLSKICSRAKEQKKLDKENVLIEGRFIDSLFNAVEGFARLTQQHAEDIEKHAERINEAELDKKAEKRNETLRNLEIDPSSIDARNMIDEVWDIYIKGVHDQYTSRKQAEAEAEAKRIQEEAKIKIFNDREKILLPFSAFAPVYDLDINTSEEEFKEMLENSEKMKAKSIEDQKKREQENLRLKKEAEERIEAEKKASEERKAKEEADRQIQEKKDAEAKKKLDEQNAEINRLNEVTAKQNAEQAKKLEEEKKKARELAKAGPIKQLIFAVENCELILPEIDDENLRDVSDDIQAKFDSFKNWAKHQLSNCK